MFRLAALIPANLSLLSFLILFAGTDHVFGQSADSVRSTLTVDFEVRPRTEYRNNFVWDAADTVLTELYTTQRNRLNITFQSAKLRLHASPQEIHIWGENNRFSRVGSVNFFELYAEPVITKNLRVRIGRQAISLDNGRIFSAAPWAQQSRAHEGIRFLYKKKLETDLTIAFTRPYGNDFDAAYSPVSAHNYKFLFVHHLKYKLNERTILTTINTMDVFRQTTGGERYYRRITNGGRLEHTIGRINGTVNAYYQYGQTATLAQISAYYIQPEVSMNAGKTSLRLGAEILSGTSIDAPKEKSYSFVPLYGVAWKFMGNMNLFTRFPADINNKGLMNPYVFLIHQAGKMLSLRADAHLFYTQHLLTNEIDGKYLGFESDLSLNYKPVKNLEINYGFSYTLASKRMELLNKVKDSGKIPIWSYLMISYAPRLLSKKWY